MTTHLGSIAPLVTVVLLAAFAGLVPAVQAGYAWLTRASGAREPREPGGRHLDLAG